MNNSKLDRRSLLKLAAATTTAASSPSATQARSVSENRARIRAKLGQTDSTVLKRTAAAEYHASLARFGGRLANSPDGLLRDPQNIDVVVIGSGYGGSILAARLAPRLYPGRRLVVLERGRECIPGTFPDTLRDCVAELRQRPLSSAALSLKNPLGLLDLCTSPDINVISGSGLGGTSLVNANVAAVPDRDVFAQDPWPRVFHDATELDLGFRLASYELNLQYSPCDTAKTRALARIGQTLNIPSEPALVAVTHQGRGLSPDRKNRQGMLQRPCTMCGDCATGCNVGAKNTLQMNYLPLAKSFGAEMYPQTEVFCIHKTSAGYCVEFFQWISTENGLTQRRGRVFAKMVILAAGSIGSTELLLRSQNTNFCFSAQLGQRWSGNGDAYGFVVGTDDVTNSGGYGAYETDQPPVGVLQQRNLALRPNVPLGQRLLVQEGNFPRAYLGIASTLFTDSTLNKSLVLFAAGHDGNRGRIEIANGQVTVRWPGRKNSEYERYVRCRLEQFARASGGRQRKLPFFGDTPLTVHPLGGCGMADHPNDGVVNDTGQVFDGQTGGLHHGLHVVDGSVIPTSLGANPFFTIAALAERTAMSILQSEQYSHLIRPVVRRAG